MSLLHFGSGIPSSTHTTYRRYAGSRTMSPLYPPLDHGQSGPVLCYIGIYIVAQTAVLTILADDGQYGQEDLLAIVLARLGQLEQDNVYMRGRINALEQHVAQMQHHYDGQISMFHQVIPGIALPSYAQLPQQNVGYPQQASIQTNNQNNIASVATTVQSSLASAQSAYQPAVAQAVGPAAAVLAPAVAPAAAFINHGHYHSQGRLKQLRDAGHVLKCICPFCGVYSSNRIDEVTQHVRGRHNKKQCAQFDANIDQDPKYPDYRYYELDPATGKLRDPGVKARILAARDQKRQQAQISSN